MITAGGGEYMCLNVSIWIVSYFVSECDNLQFAYTIWNMIFKSSNKQHARDL